MRWCMSNGMKLFSSTPGVLDWVSILNSGFFIKWTNEKQQRQQNKFHRTKSYYIEELEKV